MLKRIDWTLIFKTFAWVVCLSGVVVLMSFVGVKKATVTCTNVKILIPGADNFIEREEIDAILKQNQGILIGKKLEQINLDEIEDKLKSNPYIALAKVYADMDGVIHIEVKQRQPILRVINAGNQDFYIDRTGLKMPVSPNFTANVLVANGTIMENFSGRIDTLHTQLAVDLYKTAAFIKKDSLWDAQIEQIFVNEQKDIELIPRVGNQRIILGNADSLEVKMSNLMAFYKQAMPKVGWERYTTINIKYTNQVVCVKNELDSANRVEAGKAPLVKKAVPAGTNVIDSIVKDEIAKEIKTEVAETPKVVAVTPKPAVAKPKTVIAKPKVPVAKSVVKPEVKKVVKPEVTTKPETTKSTETKVPAKTTTTKPATAKPVTAEKKTVAAKETPAAAKLKDKTKTDTKKNK